jgi:hypothetical protein
VCCYIRRFFEEEPGAREVAVLNDFTGGARTADEQRRDRVRFG